VKRVLLTGMSGTGKSSVIRQLAALGYKAVDTDDGWCEPLPDGRQRWREDAGAAILDAHDADFLFVGGCEENQVLWVPKTYASRRYSWIMPPARSRRWTRNWSRLVTPSGSGRSDAAWLRVRCGRWVL
jgi:hypothetical protein